MNIAVSPEITNVIRPLIHIVIAGHVDHGKSTLIGRLLYETGALPDGKLEALKSISKRRGMPFEWSFLLDSLQTERDQGITIDTSQIRFRTAAREVVLIDAPGHAEFLRNMITGASQADAAILIVDAAEGVRDQTRRHGYLLHLLGLQQIAVVVNKMDRIDFDAGRFQAIKRELSAYLSGLGVTTQAFIPVSARHGDGIAARSESIAWYDGPTVLDALDRFLPSQNAPDLALRIPIQAIYKFDDRRILAGRVESGHLGVGDEIVVMPQVKVARVKSIEAWPAPGAETPLSAAAGQSIGITLDRELFVERGNVISAAMARATAARRLRARVFWLHGQALDVGDSILARVATAESPGTVTAIRHATDPGSLVEIGDNSVAQNHVGEIELLLAQPIAADLFSRNPATGRIVLERDGRIAGGGLILSIDATEASVPAARAPIDTAGLTERAGKLNQLLADLSPADRLIRLRSEIGGTLTFTTSFGLEDQAIMHLIAEHSLDIQVVTLDTGRLFQETYEVWAETELRYGVRIHAIYPDAVELGALVARQGINGFHDSREARLACCHVRKVVPLNRALDGSKAWITGLRADQSKYRQGVNFVAADTVHGLLKVSPIFDWSRERVAAFVAERNIPVNVLHGRGFASIGCAPCTRAIVPGESERAGRWWWEKDGKTECGLHIGTHKS